MPNHPHAGTSTAVARGVAISFNEASQFPLEPSASEKISFETF